MFPIVICLLLLAGLDGSAEQTLPPTFRVLVAPLPTPATLGLFPPRGEDVVEAWRSKNLDRLARLGWQEITSLPWGRVAQQVALRKPAAVLGEYQFLSATIGSGYSPYLTWSSPKPRQIASLLTIKSTGIQRIIDLRDKIVGVIDPAYRSGGGVQRGLLETSGLKADEIHVVALGTAQEVIHHLFAGTIDAAGLPQGEAENALRHFGYPDAVSEIRVIKEFKCPSQYALFVRRNLLGPIPPFPGMLANVLSELYPPGSAVRESEK